MPLVLVLCVPVSACCTPAALGVSVTLHSPLAPASPASPATPTPAAAAAAAAAPRLHLWQKPNATTSASHAARSCGGSPGCAAAAAAPSTAEAATRELPGRPGSDDAPSSGGGGAHDQLPPPPLPLGAGERRRVPFGSRGWVLLVTTKGPPLVARRGLPLGRRVDAMPTAVPAAAAVVVAVVVAVVGAVLAARQTRGMTACR